MEPIKIVVRYSNGKVIKGFTQNFLPNKGTFHLRPNGTANTNDSVEIKIDDLKAVFFVRDFSGNRTYKEKKSPPPDRNLPGA